MSFKVPQRASRMIFFFDGGPFHGQRLPVFGDPNKGWEPPSQILIGHQDLAIGWCYVYCIDRYEYRSTEQNDEPQRSDNR